MDWHSHSFGSAGILGLETGPPSLASAADRAALSGGLLIYQTFHLAITLYLGVYRRVGTCWRVGGCTRVTLHAPRHPSMALIGCCYILDWRLRRDLRMPGCRIRSRARTPCHSRTVWDEDCAAPLGYLPRDRLPAPHRRRLGMPLELPLRRRPGHYRGIADYGTPFGVTR